MFDKRVVETAQISSYEALADGAWRGKLCLASAASERSRTLVASMIARLGERNAELAVRGWRENLATGVFEDQEDVLLAIDDGRCAVGIVSSEVLARFVAMEGHDNLDFSFPSIDSGGARIDVTVAGISRHANDAEAAAEFIRWLLSEDGQLVLHGDGFQYSMDGPDGVRAPVPGWPRYAESPIGVSRAGQLHHEAALLIERARIR